MGVRVNRVNPRRAPGTPDRVAPGGLRLVQGRVGTAHPRGEVVVRPKLGYANADGDRADVPEGRVRDEGAHGVGERQRLRRGAVAQQHDELLAAPPGEHVGRAQSIAQALGELDEDLVAGLVAERVVDGREVVEVEHQERQGRAVPSGLVEVGGEQRGGVAPVPRPRQRVGDRQATEFELEAPALADVAGHAQNADHAAVRGELRHHLQLADHDRAVLAVVLELPVEGGPLGAGGDGGHEPREVLLHPGQRLARVDLVERLRGRLGRREAAHPLDRGADVRDGAVDRHGPDHVVGVLGQQPVPLLGLGERLLGHPQGRDLVRGALEDDRAVVASPAADDVVGPQGRVRHAHLLPATRRAVTRRPTPGRAHLPARCTLRTRLGGCRAQPALASTATWLVSQTALSDQPRSSRRMGGRTATLATDRPEEVRVTDDDVLAAAAAIPGWRADDEAREVLALGRAAAPGAVIVEVGAFMGRTSLLLAHSRRAAGTGRLHVVDAFDNSGDAFSIPFYDELLQASGQPDVVTAFRANMAANGVDAWIDVHVGRAVDVAAGWTLPIDLLMLDADQSVRGARATYEAWEPHLRVGGVIVLSNTYDREYAVDHDGYHRVARQELRAPKYAGIRQVDGLAIATKVDPGDGDCYVVGQ